MSKTNQFANDLERLISIYPSLKSDPSQEPGYYGDVKYFEDNYSFNPGEVLCMSYILNSDRRFVEKEKLYSYLYGKGFSAETVAYSLISKTMIVKMKSESDNQIVYRITKNACKRFSGNKDATQNCIDIILSTKDPVDKYWGFNFYEAMLGKINDNFRAKVDSLGIPSLAKKQQIAFWEMVVRFARNFAKPVVFKNNLSSEDEELRTSLKSLIGTGLIISIPFDSYHDSDTTEVLALSPKVVEELFHGVEGIVNYASIANDVDILRSCDIQKEELFFSGESQNDIDHLRTILSDKGFSRASNILKKQKRNPAIHSLLWGPPGTGKTAIAKQLARESGRDLLVWNMSKILDSSWGSSERKYNEIFLVYSYLVAVKKKAPILFMNECDSVLSNRLSNVERAIDKSENGLSNILLQNFENMSGILLATTNLIKNMDPAFERRFLFKTLIGNPDKETRAKIWRHKIENLSDEDAQRLAERFEMSGGQISNVVAKRELAELYYEGDRGYDYIADLCKKELGTSFGKQSKKVGF